MSRTNNANAGLKKFEEFARNNPKEAEERARKILIKTGVLTKSGKKKNTIVSWA